VLDTVLDVELDSVNSVDSVIDTVLDKVLDIELDSVNRVDSVDNKLLP